MRRNWLMIVCTIILWAVLPFSMLHAQDEGGDGDEPVEQATDITIAYDDEVSDTITERVFFDLFRFNGIIGETIVIRVSASDGLAPLIGLLDGARNLVAVSEDGQVNGEIELEFTVETSGEHVINVTRVGRDEGTTTGSYVLLLRRASAGGTRLNPFQDVTFRCGTTDVTSAATLDFSQQPGESYTFSVYGLDDFRPIIRMEIDLEDGFEECSTDSQRLGGNSVLLPDGETVTYAEGEPENAAQFGVGLTNQVNRITLTIGSIDGSAGRYVLVMTGFNIERAGAVDVVEFRLGPLVAETTSMTVYMVAQGSNRLDPLIEVYTDEDFDVPGLTCDDAGRRDCEAVLSFEGAGFIFDAENTLIGDRFDAGVVLNPGNTDPQTLEFSSRAESATGSYAIVVIGELPPRDSADAGD